MTESFDNKKRKHSFILYDEFINFTDDLTDEQAGRLLKAILAYRNDLDLPVMDLESLTAFRYIKKRLDKDDESYQMVCAKRADNGSKGGAAKAKKNKDQNNNKNSECYSKKEVCETVENTDVSSTSYQELANASKCYQKLANDSKSYQELAKVSKSNKTYHDSDNDNDINKKTISSDDDIAKKDSSSSSSQTITFGLMENIELGTVKDHWNELQVNPIEHFTPERKDALRRVVKQYGLPDVIKAIDRIKQSDYLLGNVNEFQVTFDWFLKNYGKVADGNYDKREAIKKLKNDFGIADQHEYDMDEFEKSILSN